MHPQGLTAAATGARSLSLLDISNAWGGWVIRRIITVLAILHCLAFIDRTMIGGALPLMRLDLPMTDAGAGWLIGTAFAVPYGVTALALAAMLRGRRASPWWLIGGVAVWTAATLVTGAAQSTTMLMLARAGLGIGQAMFVPVAIAWLVDTAGADGRARALSVFTSGSTIGRSTALLAIGALLSVLTVLAPVDPANPLSGVAHWRWLFVITALPNIVMLPLLVGIRRSAARIGPVGPLPDGPPTNPLPAEVRWSTIALYFAAAIMPVLLIQAMGAWLPTLFVRDRGLLPAEAAILLGGRLPDEVLDRLADETHRKMTAAAATIPASAPIRRATLSRDAPAVGAAILPFLDRMLPSDAILIKS